MRLATLRFASSLVALAVGLGNQVIAAGVETEERRAILRRLDCGVVRAICSAPYAGAPYHGMAAEPGSGHIDAAPVFCVRMVLRAEWGHSPVDVMP